MTDLRCENGIKFGEVVGDFLEFKCRSKRCGKEEGVMIIHRFDHAGQFQETLVLREPKIGKEDHGKHSLRSS